MTARLIDIELVRANVRITRSAQAAQVRILPASRDAHSAVNISIVETPTTVTIRDIYPAGSGFAKECLPPVDARGDYWAYNVPLAAEIAVPEATPLRVHLLDGDISVNGVDGQFDLLTNRGAVSRNKP